MAGRLSKNMNQTSWLPIQRMKRSSRKQKKRRVEKGKQDKRTNNKCHTWPFLDLNISSVFLLIYFLSNLSTFSSFKFSCHHIAAMARMLSLFSDCQYNFFFVMQLGSHNFPFSFSISAIKFL